MTTTAQQQLTIAVIGAGGKMGMRVSNNLQRSNHTVYYSENSPAGQQRTIDAGRTVTDTAIRDHLARHVAKWWLPDAIVFVDELPHTATGKLLKTALRERFRNFTLTDA